MRVFRGPLSYHAMIEVVDGRHYALLQDQSDFEERERVLFAVVRSVSFWPWRWRCFWAGCWRAGSWRL